MATLEWSCIYCIGISTISVDFQHVHDVKTGHVAAWMGPVIEKSAAHRFTAGWTGGYVWHIACCKQQRMSLA